MLMPTYPLSKASYSPTATLCEPKAARARRDGGRTRRRIFGHGAAGSDLADLA